MEIGIGGLLNKEDIMSVDLRKILIFENYLKPGMIVINAGACRGHYTKIFSNCIKPNGKVIAFEPEKESFEVLQNKFKNEDTVVLEEKALSNYCGFGNLQVCKQIGHHHISDSGNLRVQVVTIDSYCTYNNIDKVNFIKMDVEGQDLNLLIGAQNIIKKSNLLVIVAELHYHHFKLDKDKVNEFFKSNNFELYSLRKDFEKIEETSSTNDEIVALKGIKLEEIISNKS